MKKHIIIAGVPRAGKSTICKKISQQFGYQHISMDSIIAGIETVFPQTGIDSDANIPPKINITNISAKMGPFLRAMMDSGEYDECDYGMVIDIFQLLPEDYVRYIDRSVCDIFYFVTSDVTAEERYEILKRYDTPLDYTYYHTDEENHQDCADIVDISKLFKEQCAQYRLPCYETARDRELVIASFMDTMGNGG